MVDLNACAGGDKLRQAQYSAQWRGSEYPCRLERHGTSRADSAAYEEGDEEDQSHREPIDPLTI
jgi:hypothetical protein